MQVSPQFENDIVKWVKIDNKIKSANGALKILRKEKDITGENILIYIKTNSLEDHPINITGGKLKLATSKTTSPINKKFIEERLSQYFKSNSKAKEVADFIFNSRETTEKDVLRRTNSRTNS